MDKYKILQKYFGHTQFRNGQEEVCDALNSKRDVLCVMPTGAGKSVCYQIPALMSDGITLIISPLVALMKDQVMNLVGMGIRAAYLNSSLTQAQYNLALERACLGWYKIIYVSPERLTTQGFRRLCQHLKISMLIVDEAHCISQWGHDFRKSYLKIPEFISFLPERPVVGAFTATATEAVKEDISKILGLISPVSLTTGFDRKNLKFSVIHSDERHIELLKILKKKRDLSGIIYCATRKNVDEICTFLNNNRFPAVKYHAGLSDGERASSQDQFIYDRKKIIVATNAFGMGIDKSNVAFVIHFNMPRDMESYYQEAGRAGRDGSPAECILMYDDSDIGLNAFIIENSFIDSEDIPGSAKRIENAYRKMDYMKYYCNTSDCLRLTILKYFGETADSFCGNCSSCDLNTETLEILKPAKQILFCIQEIGQSFGITTVIDILKGKRCLNADKFDLYQLPCWGALSDYSEKQLRFIINYLISQGFIEKTEGEYPVLIFTGKTSSLMTRNLPLAIHVPPALKLRKKTQGDAPAVSDSVLLSRLRDLRQVLAANEHVPPYIIFSDATLYEICSKRPRSMAEMKGISGIGFIKLHKYGKRIADLINDYENGRV